MATSHNPDYYVRQHVHNFVALELRKMFPTDDNSDKGKHERLILSTLALNFADRFKKQNPKFNHLAWLDQCSPNQEMYPLSELWEIHHPTTERSYIE